MFTRISNFSYGAYKIANIDEVAVSNNIELKLHILKYEEEFLRMYLGDCLYSDLMDNVELDSDGYWKLKSGAAEKWGWLLNGRTYTATSLTSGCGCSSHSSSCDKHKWDGLVKKIATIESVDVFETIMASYIFYHWSLDNRTLNLGVGEGNITAQNTTQASTANKRCDAWNKMVQDVDYGYTNTRVSLNQFLRGHPEEFTNAELVCLTPMTYYDI
jgi:hypothetical protein